MNLAHAETVTRQRATPVTDPYSGEQTGESWQDPDELDIPAAVALGGTTETPGIDRTPVASDFDLYTADPDVDVTARDRLVIRGLVCQVIGRPFTWHHPMSGWRPGAFIQAKIVEG